MIQRVKQKTGFTKLLTQTLSECNSYYTEVIDYRISKNTFIIIPGIKCLVSIIISIKVYRLILLDLQLSIFFLHCNIFSNIV